MAIQGEGFFVYNLNGRQLYSRAGVISRDRDGYLVDSSTGAYMQGYNLLTESGKIKKDSAGVNLLDRTISSLKISTNTMSQPKQTENIKISGNLNSTNETDAERQTSITIFDSAGTPHTVTFTFTKTDVNKYSVEVSAMINGTKTVIGSGTNIEFNPDGTIKAPDPAEFTLAAGDLNTAFGTVFDAAKDIKVTLAPTDNKLAGLTEFSGPNTATANEQDGFQTGELIDLAVDPTGKIWGSFTNGQSEVLGQVVTAKFTNPTALIREGNNLLASSPDSGLPNIGTAGEIFPSTKIVGGALEQSNVDMTEQFTEMIIAQRAFEAASRTITVSDQMLAETNMIKR
jgi:flagellar hook protein FlgE